jgi:hypothetical protein
MLIAILFIVGVVFGLFGGWTASQKNRDAGEGAVLGFLFGPFGVLVEALLPTKEPGPEPPSAMARGFREKMTDQGRVVRNLQDEAAERERRLARARALDEEWLARKEESDRLRDERREWTRRVIWRFGWFRSMPETLQPILIGMAVSIPILFLMIYVVGPRL